jgi:pimeloyl-ACP methyl ester carboxylesterase
MTIHRFALVLAAAALTLAPGCSEEEIPISQDGGGSGVGEPCKSVNDCELTLDCAGTGTCQKKGGPGTASRGEGCGFNTDCKIEYQCASNGTCVNPGSGKEDAECQGNEGCEQGLLCSATKTCAKAGSSGTKTPGEACAGALECAFGLVCVGEKCKAITYWTGVQCAKDTGKLRSYFEVPKTGQTPTEFYRLPFPNDIRLKGGFVDVSGHPNPGTALPKEYGDVVGSYYKAINKEVTGFGLNTATFFRMSKDFDLSTIKVEIINIDGASPDYGRKSGYNMWATTGQGKYICPNYIAVRPTTGKPLEAATTYAVILRSGIKDSKNAVAAKDAHFEQMLKDTAPTGSDLAAAHTAYKPLRDYLAAAKTTLTEADILNVAVFTTMDPRAKMAGFRAAVHGQASKPAPTELTLCDGMKKSPCEDAKNPDHICATTPHGSFHEIQGRYNTPVFQTGTRPYKTSGGEIAYKQGQPIVQGQEKLCFALTVPKGATMPANGWPIVIYAHGTGGSYRSFVGNGTGENLANVKDAAGTVANMAVISIDGAMHGPRRNSTDKPDDLFFNLQNPQAARDNTYQGAADKFELVRLIKELNLDTTTSPTGEAIKFDTTKIYYYGHSQGTIEGIPFLAYEPDVAATVLSGAGGYLLGSLLWKTKPVNVAGAIQLALADNKVSTSHPLLNLLQLYFEEVDAINYGKAIFNSPVTGVEAKHTFLGYGISDSYTPPNTIDALGWSMAIRQVKQSAQRCGDGVCNGTENCKNTNGSSVTDACEDDCGACEASTTCGNSTCEAKEKCSSCPADCKPCKELYATDDPPVKGNYDTGGKKYTVGLVQYAADGDYDDHFVLSKHKDGVTQSTHFLGSAARDGSPTILKVK